MFLNIKEMEVRRIRFDETFEPGEIDFSDTGLRQVSGVHAEGSASVLENSGGEMRVEGRFSGTFEADCDRCLATALYPLDNAFDFGLGSVVGAHSVNSDSHHNVREAFRGCYCSATSITARPWYCPAGAADQKDLPRGLQGNLSGVRGQSQRSGVRLPCEAGRRSLGSPEEFIIERS